MKEMQLSNLSTWLISGRICVYYTISSISLGVQTVKNMPAIWDQEDRCRRAWQPTPVFLSGESMDRGTWWTTVHVVQRLGHDWVTNTHIYYITTLGDLSYPKHQKGIRCATKGPWNLVLCKMSMNVFGPSHMVLHRTKCPRPFGMNQVLSGGFGQDQTPFITSKTQLWTKERIKISLPLYRLNNNSNKKSVMKYNDGFSILIWPEFKQEKNSKIENKMRRGSACILCCIWLFETPWTVDCQAPLSSRFSRQA